ncbi:dTDP-4-dehydrorhamnose 3,5-epimerase [Prochlorococcus sp. MIT 1011]|uniref:dTDP-4-dehydrorhamnose 3,5-epimerase n=1 Tax=Prochlorococcus sp. MIT 1011 TaxID=3082520 RepID=UPI0039B4855C
MKIVNLKTLEGQEVEGLRLIQPEIFNDHRGFFYESWNQVKFNENVGESISFHQDNISFSKKDTIRGLHYQLNPKPQGKLISCSFGSVFDVAVDLRSQSLTFGSWIGVELSFENNHQLWIPPGFAHGFLVVSEFAQVQYKVNGFWDKSSERSIYWNDPELSIEWPIKNIASFKPIISTKDFSSPMFNQVKIKGDIF